MNENAEPALGAALDQLLSNTVKRTRSVRHGLLAVAADDGSWSWRGAHGTANAAGAPVTVDTRYPIASVTKLFTTTVAMRLVEQGRLQLDQQVVDVLPAAVTDRLHVIKGVDHTRQITVEHLLSHTSGLADYYEQSPRGGRSAQQRLLDGEDAPMPFDEVLRVVRDELTPHFAPQPLTNDRRRARYADTNFQLLGAVIEAITATELRRVFGDTIFAPLGLDNTASYPDAPRSGAHAEPDVSVWSSNTVLEPRGALTHQVADGGIVSNLADQVRFLQALIGPEIFENQTTWRNTHARCNRIFFPIEYGLGVMRYAPPRWMSPLFAVPPLVGHSGSTATWLFHCPDLGIVTAGALDVAKPALPFRFLPRVLQVIHRTQSRDN